MGQSKHRWVWLLLLVGLAAASRFWQLDSLPPGLHPREAEYALQASGLQDSGMAGPLPVALVSLSFDLFEVTPWAVRITSALAGMLLVLATYAAAATLRQPDQRPLTHPFPLSGSQIKSGSVWWPLLAVFVGSSLYPALALSRWGTPHLWSGALATLAVACFWHGLNAAATSPNSSRSRSRTALLRRWPWLTLPLWHPATPALSLGLVGLWMGLGWLTTAAAIPFPLLFALFILLRAGANRARPGIQQPPWWPMGLTFLLVAVPGLLLSPSNSWIRQLAHQPEPGRLLAGLFWSGTADLAINLPGRPFLDGVQVVLLLAGIGVLAWRWRHGRGLFLALWLGFALLPALLSTANDFWPHLLFAAAPLCLLMALGLEWLGQQISRLSHRYLHWPLFTSHWVLLPLILLWLPSLVLTLRAYFVTFANQPTLNQSFAATEWRLGQHAAAYPPETLLYLSPPSVNHSIIQFALSDSSRLWSFTPDEAVLPLGRLETPVLYLVASDQVQIITQLSALFPEATVGDTPVDAYRSVYLPAFVPRLPQAHLTDLLWDGKIGLVDWNVTPVDDDLQVQLYWQAAAIPQENYIAYVHLRDSAGNLVGQSETALESYPTTQWHRQEVVRGTFHLLAPSVGGPYQLITGFLDPATQTVLGEAILTTLP
jgi:hypothetical protein